MVSVMAHESRHPPRGAPRARRPILLAAILVAWSIAGSLSGCGTSGNPTPLMIGMNSWTGYTPLLVAGDLGHIDTGRVKFSEQGSASYVLQGLRSGVLDGACLTLDEAILATSQGCDIVVVAVLDFSNGADALLADPDALTSLADLQGKRIGVELSAVGAYMLDRILERARLSDTDVIPLHLPVDQHEEAFRTGRIDAVITFDPARTRLVQGGAVVLFSSAEIPGEIVDVLVLRREALAARPTDVRALLEGWNRVVQFRERDPDGYARLAAPHLGIPVSLVEEAYAGLDIPDPPRSRALLEGPSPLLLETAIRLRDAMQGAHHLDAPIDVRRLFPGRVPE